jgi:hypothetical protein
LSIPICDTHNQPRIPQKLDQELNDITEFPLPPHISVRTKVEDIREKKASDKIEKMNEKLHDPINSCIIQNLPKL